jgi:SAM-dependent methyltransferase
MADKADRYELYEAAVQDVDAELEFINETFVTLRGRSPRAFREDFAGLGSLACRWVRQGREYRAIAVDNDSEVLEAGRLRRRSRLTPTERRRVHWLCADVLAVRNDPVDVITACNFSYWVFKTRSLMRRYFKSAYKGLAADGLFVLDAFGGYEACQEMKESRRLGLFTYVWEQAEYLPVTGDISCHIHFRFPDRSRIDRAFSYDWRLWTLPEIRELLGEAGFRKTTVYWEGTDKRGLGNGEFRPELRGAADAAWIAYIVAEKS